jgi:hypothetical protein
MWLAAGVHTLPAASQSGLRIKVRVNIISEYEIENIAAIRFVGRFYSPFLAKRPRARDRDSGHPTSMIELHSSSRISLRTGFLGASQAV